MESMNRAAFVLFFGSALLLESQPNVTMAQAAAELAARTSSQLPHRTAVSLDWQNLAALPANEWSSFRSRFEQELRKAGVEIAAAERAATPPESRLRVTVSQAAHQLLFIAEVPNADNKRVVMLPWPATDIADTKPPLRIVLNPLLTSSQPILDVLNDDSELIVLSISQVTRYRQSDGKWMPDATVSLTLPRPMPRDPRGRFQPAAGGFQAFLPIATCTGSWNPELKLSCAGGTANWPGTSGTHWLADRNVLEGDSPAPSFEGWGSDWANIGDPCGAGTITIADSANDNHDSVRAYVIGDGRADPVSDPLPLTGPVTALWPAQSGREATLVVHNLQTGEYEASRLGLACNR